MYARMQPELYSMNIHLPVAPVKWLCGAHAINAMCTEHTALVIGAQQQKLLLCGSHEGQLCAWTECCVQPRRPDAGVKNGCVKSSHIKIDNDFREQKIWFPAAHEFFFFDWVHIMRTGAKHFLVLQPMSILVLFSRPSCFSLKRAVNFCDYPQEEKKKFLEGKLSEEEIGEVMRRYNE